MIDGVSTLPIRILAGSCMLNMHHPAFAARWDEREVKNTKENNDHCYKPFPHTAVTYCFLLCLQLMHWCPLLTSRCGKNELWSKEYM